MGCTFCATGTMGLKKNLTPYEIIDMVVLVQTELHKRDEEVTNVVYMGMGEPLATYPAVKESLQMLHDKVGLGWRKITVSTSGIPDKIVTFAKDFPQVNLAISLHAAINDKRSKLMPINKRFSVQEVMKAAHEYIKITNRKIFFEYLVIDGFNDGEDDVVALKEILKHKLFHLNLIRFHETDAVKAAYGVKWRAPSRERLNAFMTALTRAGLILTLRRSFGEGLDAACGMLALKNSNK